MASPQVLKEVKTAMTEYYTLLSQMPHYSPDSLCLPPPEGWPDMDREAFRELGCSDDAIEFASHLPCMDPCVNSDRAWIAAWASAVGYHRGYKWEPRLEYEPAEGSVFPPVMPAHLFQLTNYRPVDMGYSLLCLDTQQGTIIEMREEGPRFKPGTTEEAYDAMPESEQWTAYPPVSAKDFFDRETVRLLRLVYIPVPPAIPEQRNYTARPEFYQRVEHWEEHELAQLDDEWDAEHADDPDYDGGSLPDAELEGLQLGSESEGFVVIDEDIDEDEDMSVDGDEVNELRAEAEAMEFDGPPQEGPRPLSLKPHFHPEETQRAYVIYKSNGWPYEHFNAEQCRTELLSLALQINEDQERQMREHEDEDQFSEEASDEPEGSPATTEHSRKWKERLKRLANDRLIVPSERWCEDRREQMKQKLLAEGKSWDEENGKDQTAREWWAAHNAREAEPPVTTSERMQQDPPQPPVFVPAPMQQEPEKKQEAQNNNAPSSAEVWCEDRRQRMKKKILAEGKPWDEEKEKTQSAEEWWAEFQQAKRAR